MPLKILLACTGLLSLLTLHTPLLELRLAKGGFFISYFKSVKSPSLEAIETNTSGDAEPCQKKRKLSKKERYMQRKEVGRHMVKSVLMCFC